jgi:hypothetical protein
MCQSLTPALRACEFALIRDADGGRGAAFVRLTRQESRSIASTTLVLLSRFCRYGEGTGGQSSAHIARGKCRK